MTNVHRKASEEMRELQESTTSALSSFKSLQAYLAEPCMQASILAFCRKSFVFSHVDQPAELLSHLQEFVSAFKETVRVNEEGRKEIQRLAAERMVSISSAATASSCSYLCSIWKAAAAARRGGLRWLGQATLQPAADPATCNRFLKPLKL
jgi:hypothetical protein